jgi:hypothetical protein
VGSCSCYYKLGTTVAVIRHLFLNRYECWNKDMDNDSGVSGDIEMVLKCRQ